MEVKKRGRKRYDCNNSRYYGYRQIWLTKHKPRPRGSSQFRRRTYDILLYVCAVRSQYHVGDMHFHKNNIPEETMISSHRSRHGDSICDECERTVRRIGLTLRIRLNREEKLGSLSFPGGVSISRLVLSSATGVFLPSQRIGRRKERASNLIPAICLLESDPSPSPFLARPGIHFSR